MRAFDKARSSDNGDHAVVLLIQGEKFSSAFPDAQMALAAPLPILATCSYLCHGKYKVGTMRGSDTCQQWFPELQEEARAL